MPKQPALLLEHWYSALRSPSGVCIRVSDIELAKAQLYRARKDALDPQLDALSLVQSPTAADELWIVHKGPADGS